MNNFTLKQKKILLMVARQAIDSQFTGQDYQLPAVDFLFNSTDGVFVTLKKQGKLRGCVGVFAPSLSLGDAVIKMARDAAFADPRFPPLSLVEWPEIKIEVSALSSWRQVKSAEKIDFGRHGVYLEWQDKSGTYLPQVAENFQNKEDFLNNLCQDKLGAPVGCWRDPMAKIYIYEAETGEEL